jgi:hypothetical protein
MRADNVSENKIALGLIAKGAPEYDMKFTPYISFSEASLIPRRPLIGGLNEFARFASAIIKLFDD